MDEHTSVGERIAYYRRRRGLTQEVLAGLVGRSVPWLSLIERGERTVEKIADLLTLARVLKVSPGDLIGGIELPPNGGGPLDPPQGIPAIHRALLTVHLPDREPPIPEQLRADLERAAHLIDDARHEAAAIVLPDLILSARATVTHEVPGAWWYLASAYQAASSLARHVGEANVAWIAADRAVAAAEQSDDELLMAVSKRRLANALMRHGMLDEAGAVCSNAADAIAPTDATPPEGLVVWGNLHLTEAVLTARSKDTAGGWRLLRDVRAAAERVEPSRKAYWEALGIAGVGLNEVTVALESGNTVEALRLADTVEVDELPTAHLRARFGITAAHAYVLRGSNHDGAAVAQLLEAERHAPEEVRYSVLAHELVRVLLGRERRSRTPGLRGLAARLGVGV
jgi:transcriptional regulator with XRE-family HTH domain